MKCSNGQDLATTYVLVVYDREIRGDGGYVETYLCDECNRKFTPDVGEISSRGRKVVEVTSRPIS